MCSTYALRKMLQKVMTNLSELQYEVDKRKCAKESAEETFRGKRAVAESPNVPMDEYIVGFCDLDCQARELVEAALCVRLNAYVPYSQTRVGAAFRSANGNQIFTGCNVENVAISPGCCAERSAITKAISEGHQEFSAGAMVAYQTQGFATPCGVCRQFILEFATSDIPIYIARAPAVDCTEIGDDDDVLVTSIYNLMPHSFSSFE